ICSPYSKRRTKNLQCLEAAKCFGKICIYNGTRNKLMKKILLAITLLCATPIYTGPTVSTASKEKSREQLKNELRYNAHRTCKKFANNKISIDEFDKQI